MHCRHDVVETSESNHAIQLHQLKLTLAQEIETWVSALGHYDNNGFDEALKDFETIADTSKILFNMGVIHATLGEHEKAVSVEATAGTLASC